MTRSLGLVLAVVTGFVWRNAVTGELGGDRSAWNVLILTLDTTRADRLGAYGFVGAAPRPDITHFSPAYYLRVIESRDACP